MQKPKQSKLNMPWQSTYCKGCLLKDCSCSMVMQATEEKNAPGTQQGCTGRTTSVVDGTGCAQLSVVVLAGWQAV